MSTHRDRVIFIKCPKCEGHKGVSGRSTLGHPATLPCPRCDAVGEVPQDSLTELEKNPPQPIRYERDDL
ncbi:MAG: hypothetical protein ACREBR_04635 [bacterium]